MVSAAMSTEDRSEGPQSNANPQAASETMLDTRGRHMDDGVQLKRQFPSVGDYALKVRKPYTITKQREKWTEEEHKKFLEALKLYGRAWRRIEDHVGTKTAVQIRSHAQKFFSKVVRESNTSDTSPVEPIEIPPPRPKRKPLHPYPRKMVASSEMGTLVGEQPTRSRSLNVSTSEQDNQSPTSVFSAISSEMYGTTDSNARNDSPSPVSSPNGGNTSCFSLSEPPISSQKERGPSYLDRSGNPSDPHEQVPMTLELFPRRCVSTKEAQDEVVPGQSLKLFGKTVSVSESRGPSSFPSSRASDGGMLYTLHVPVPMKAHLLFIAPNREVQKSGSWNSNSNRLVKKDWGLNTQNPQFFSNAPRDNSSSLGQRPKPHNSSKGFIPYKRCLAERETQLSAMANEEREEKRIRLCL